MPGLGDGALPELPAVPPAPRALRERHPRIEALAEDLSAARLSRRAAERIVGWPELTAGWQRQELDAGSVEGPILGFSWPLPLIDRNRAERGLSAAREQAAEARYEAASLRLDADRAGALAACRRLAAGARQAHEATEGNAAMLAGAVAAFEQGEASVTDLLETLRSALEAEISALEVHGAALAAFRRLEEAAGVPLHGGDRPTLETEIQPNIGDSP
jgi:cobalt-zinc-cadmium efflux system outer membrane protein